ncbi:MAG: hypothetical protein RSE93_02295 [Oscillospiraceae bacterium]
MEKVFDLREFFIELWSKFKKIIILAVVFMLVGGLFGYIKFPKEDVKKGISTATVILVDKNQDATALNSAMIMLSDYLKSDAYIISLINHLNQMVSPEDFETFFDGDMTPSVSQFKEHITISIKGSAIISEATASHPTLPQQVSEICRDYAVLNAPKYNRDLYVEPLTTEVINVTMQNNDFLLKDILKFSILGLGGGIILGILLFFFIDVIDIKLRNPEQLKNKSVAYIGEYSLENKEVIKSIADITADKNIAVISSNGEDLKAFSKEIGDVTAYSLDNPEDIKNIRKADGVVFCERNKISRLDEIDKAINTINNLKVKIIGFIYLP